jgi:hypothetical protein
MAAIDSLKWKNIRIVYFAVLGIRVKKKAIGKIPLFIDGTPEPFPWVMGAHFEPPEYGIRKTFVDQEKFPPDNDSS